MTLFCPLCQHPFAPGAQSCPGCGASLLLDAVPGATHPVCAVHPTRRGLGTCTRCGSFACAQCLRPGHSGEALCARCHSLDPDAPLPWDKREELGLLRALWKTSVQVMLSPDSFSRARANGRARDSLLFSFLCSLPACFTTGLFYLALFFLMPQLVNEFGPPGKGLEGSSEQFIQGMGLAFFVGTCTIGPLMSLAMTIVGAGLDHLLLRMGGATRDYRVTLRAYSLTQAPWLLGIIPIVGSQVAPFWALVSRAFAYRGLHRTTWGPALAGALIAPLAFCCTCGGSYLALIAFAFARAGNT